MLEFNLPKMLRQVDNRLKQKYFSSRVPEMSVDWSKVGVRNIEELLTKINQLPEENRNLLNRELNDAFDVSECRNSGIVIHNLLKLNNIVPPEDFSGWTLPNQSLWFLMHSPDNVRTQLLRLSEVGNISEHWWLVQKLNTGITGPMEYSDARMDALREALSSFLCRHTGYGQYNIIERVNNSDQQEELFFVYYNKPQRVAPQWDNNQFSWGIDRKSAELVFAYNIHRNELRLKAKNLDRQKKTALCAIWAEKMRDTTLAESALVEKQYELDAFLSREKCVLPDSLWGTFVKFEVPYIKIDIDGVCGKKATFDKSQGDVYDLLDALFDSNQACRNLTSILDIHFKVKLAPRFKYNREIAIRFKSDSTDIYSKNEGIRHVLVDAFRKLGVIKETDAQPANDQTLCGGISGEDNDERTPVAV